MSADITWCIEANCPETTCFRNTKNMQKDATPWHSYAKLKDTQLCPMFNAVEPVRSSLGFWTCGECGDAIRFMDHYCHNCGRRQKWD